MFCGQGPGNTLVLNNTMCQATRWGSGSPNVLIAVASLGAQAVGTQALIVAVPKL